MAIHRLPQGSVFVAICLSGESPFYLSSFPLLLCLFIASIFYSSFLLIPYLPDGESTSIPGPAVDLNLYLGLDPSLGLVLFLDFF